MKIFRRDFKPKPQKKVVTTPGYLIGNLVSDNEMKIVSAVALAHAVHINLRVWFAKSQAQQKKISAYEKLTMDLLKKTEPLGKTDLERIGNKINKLDEDMNFTEQDSPIGHINFVLTTMNGCHEILEKTSLKDSRDEIHQIERSLYGFYNYASREWPDKANDEALKATQTFNFWEGLFK